MYYTRGPLNSELPYDLGAVIMWAKPEESGELNRQVTYPRAPQVSKMPPSDPIA